MPIKGNSKTAKKRTCWLFTEHHSNERKDLDDIKPENYSLSLCVRGFEESNPSSSSTFSTKTQRRWRSDSILENQRTSSESISTSSLLVWRSLESMLGCRRRSEKEISVLHWYSGIIIYFRALQGHSGRNLIDPLLQDNVVIQGGFFPHIYYIGCAFNLHSIINNGLIPGGQNSSKRQTVFFCLLIPGWTNWLECTTSCTIPA